MHSVAVLVLGSDIESVGSSGETVVGVENCHHEGVYCVGTLKSFII